MYLICCLPHPCPKPLHTSQFWSAQYSRNFALLLVLQIVCGTTGWCVHESRRLAQVPATVQDGYLCPAVVGFQVKSCSVLQDESLLQKTLGGSMAKRMKDRP